jgi:hypothetical protein
LTPDGAERDARVACAEDDFYERRHVEPRPTGSIGRPGERGQVVLERLPDVRELALPFSRGLIDAREGEPKACFVPAWVDGDFVRAHAQIVLRTGFAHRAPGDIGRLPVVVA